VGAARQSCDGSGMGRDGQTRGRHRYSGNPLLGRQGCLKHETRCQKAERDLNETSKPAPHIFLFYLPYEMPKVGGLVLQFRTRL
jgi:hypothetical protein